jgi:hypothetical protein
MYSVITLIEIFKAYSILKRNLFYSDNFLIFFVRIGPSETVYWLGGPSVSDFLQWDWIFVEARLIKQ